MLGDGPEFDLADLETARFQVGVGREEDAALRLPAGGLELSSALATLERSLILQALERSGGNKSNAAKLLGLKRTTFVEKMRRLAAPDLEY